MTRVAFFDTKPYDKVWFDRLSGEYGVEITYFESKLNERTASLAAGYEVACAFVNDTITEAVINELYEGGVRLLAMRCAGYNNIDFKAAFGKIHIVRVPAYSPYAVAEHAMALLLSVVRQTHHSYVRTREFNFSLNGLVGFDLHGKTIGVVGTGKIGKVFIDICKGFGMHVLAYDPYPDPKLEVTYCSFEELCRQSDIISLHCPLTEQSFHLINRNTISLMKDGVVLINTSRGALVESQALLEGIKSKKIGAAALDVYEEEGEVFYEDRSTTILDDDVLMLLISMPNVLVTSHQAFLTKEALHNIAQTTLGSIQSFASGEVMEHEICYQCDTCKKVTGQRCF
ncbi:MAG: 2-hydroxyacid dehydrogenase [Sphaerochaeta sp.]|uniref:2-hydroxyacid dehydrogenase n=1 Tax=uncultured Sphaerochaeta sp. TaxID=886478 RepID=UPI000E7F8D7A|nr:2-hydroxyacid dehydrogenase [uncultured Sphaerochaeta sp.]MEA4866350.1 2-hydroxyacid dehydrogenase [Sphaerochaeta sp.]HAP57045.1 hydroxyacid dehydrogenase [Sphaerochaeta sp.]HBO35017.1 hydroxyacid dehydrogenase [Sphaerochaeta sp.]